jgi:hypothetical protein
VAGSVRRLKTACGSGLAVGVTDNIYVRGTFLPSGATSKYAWHASTTFGEGLQCLWAGRAAVFGIIFAVFCIPCYGRPGSGLVRFFEECCLIQFTQ